MRFVALLIVAAISFADQPALAGQTGQSTSAAATVRISAELTRKIDSKDAKAGDEVMARTTAAATLADGSALPAGSKLTGTVTEVRAKSNTSTNSHLGITFRSATTRDGHEIPLHATLKSMAAPAPMAGLSIAPDVSGRSSGSEGMPKLSSGHSSGGKTRGTQAGTDSMDGTGGLDAGAPPDTPSGRPTRVDDSRVESTSATGDYVHDALALHRYPVGNMPGVILSSQVTASISGALDAPGQNIRLESGTRMTMDVSIVPR